MSLNLAVLLRDAARRAPDRCALISGDRHLSYRELHDAAYAFLERGTGRNGYVWYADQAAGQDDWADSYDDVKKIESDWDSYHPSGFVYPVTFSDDYFDVGPDLF